MCSQIVGIHINIYSILEQYISELVISVFVISRFPISLFFIPLFIVEYFCLSSDSPNQSRFFNLTLHTIEHSIIICI